MAGIVLGHNLNNKASTLDQEVIDLKQYFAEAKDLAAEKNKAVKVELVCPIGQGEKCLLYIKKAVGEGYKIWGWITVVKNDLQWSHSTEVVNSQRYDWTETMPEEYRTFWVIYSPDGVFRSDPNPFKIFLYIHTAGETGMKNGWQVSINQNSGELHMIKTMAEVLS
jgi:hypothetical protein